MTMKTLTNSHVNGRKQHATCKVNYFFHYQQPSLPPSVAQLQRLLQKPIQFVTATQLTVADEARMQPNSTTSSGDYDENVQQQFNLPHMLLQSTDKIIETRHPGRSESTTTPGQSGLGLHKQTEQLLSQQPSHCTAPCTKIRELA